MSKNLIKANRIILKENKPLVVDTNSLLQKRLQAVFPAFGEGTAGGFQSGLDVPVVEALLEEESELQELAGMEMSSQPVYTGPSPEELIAEAQAEIDEMRREAEKNISFLKKRSMEEGRNQGYEEGKSLAMQELEQEKQILRAKEKQLEEEYQNRIDALEPMFIETLTGIYEQIFNVELAGHKQILMHTISNTIRHIEGCRDFMVHVSREDYKKIIKDKAVLMSSLASSNYTLEIIEDVMLKENECMIETGSGIYDCGLGTQLQELRQRLTLLSYEK